MCVAILASLLAVVNLLKNPSFEDWPDGEVLPKGWSCHDRKTAPERVSRLFAVGTDGEYAVRITNGSMGNALMQPVKVTPGKYYNLSVDCRIDVSMYGMWMMPYFQDAAGRRIPNANKPGGRCWVGFKAPWTPLSVKNLLAPTNAATLVMNLVSNDSWSHMGVRGDIDLDNAYVWESTSVVDDRPVEIAADPSVEVLAAELSPRYTQAAVLVKGKGKFRLVAEEPIEGGKVVIGGEREFELAGGEEKSVFLPLETSSIGTRLTLFRGRKAVWRKAFKEGDRFLRFGTQDLFDVRKNEIFVPNDAKWYTNFPIENNLVAKPGNTNREFGNPTNLNARLFFEVPEAIEILGVKYSDWGGDNPYQKPIASKKSAWNGRSTVIYELPVFVSGVKRPLVFMKSSLRSGEVTRSRAWMTWDGGRQVPQEFKTRTVAFGRVRPFERMQMRMDDLMPNLIYAITDDPAHELPTLGVNAMRLEWEPSKKSRQLYYPAFKEKYPQLIKRMTDEMKASGLKWYFHVPNELSLNCWYEPTSWGNHANMSADPTAAYVNIDGAPQKVSSGGNFVPPCPNYRGTNFHAEVKWVLGSEAVKDYGVTWIVCDWEYWGLPCYCERCRKLFKEKWCPEHKLPDFGDPREFMRDQTANQKAAAAYKAFFDWSRGQMYVDFKAELDKGLEPNRTTWCAPKPGRFLISDWISPQPHLLPGIDYFDWPFGYRAPWQRMKQTEQILSETLKGRHDNFTCSVCPMQGCETCFEDPPISTYYNILEAAASGAQGFEWWYAPICEAMTWKFVMLGLQAIRPYENLIMDGEVTVRGEGEKCSWRRVAKDGEALYCVRNYELKDAAEVSFEVIARAGDIARDCSTGKILAKLADGKNTIRLTLKPNCLARLIYIGKR